MKSALNVTSHDNNNNNDGNSGSIEIRLDWLIGSEKMEAFSGYYSQLLLLIPLLLVTTITG